MTQKPTSFIDELAGNVSRMRFNRTEAAGALGDLGTFLPLLVGMVSVCGLQFGPALLCAGLMHLVSGVVFGIPMPVQPMKAIAAVAITEGLHEPQLLAAGIATSGVVLLLAVTGLIDRLGRALRRSVVRGLQLALGLKLLVQGVGMIAGTRALIGWDSIGLGVLCAALVLFLYASRRVPSALVLFGLGLVALIGAHPSLLAQVRLGMSWHLPDLTNASDWAAGLSRGALPQIPLTLLNSVLAVCALSVDLFPRQPAPPRRVAISVAMMNLISCPFGGMPMCHGAGGLAAQYRFGARTGGSVVILGATQIVLAVLFGGSLLAWTQAFPASVLGVLLLFGGLELALVCRDQARRRAFFVVLLTAGVCLAVNMAVGFVCGWLVAAVAAWRELLVEPSVAEGSPDDPTAGQVDSPDLPPDEGPGASPR